MSVRPSEAQAVVGHHAPARRDREGFGEIPPERYAP